ncbi:MAG: hypothetical protein WCJ35_08665 [Planctomycetota bacterium]
MCRLPLLGEWAKHDSYFCAGPKEVFLPKSDICEGNRPGHPVHFDNTVTPLVIDASVGQLGTQVVTADARFWNSLSNTHWSTSICWIENVP